MKTEEEKPKIRVNHLKLLYIENLNRILDPKKILETDLTEIFWYTLISTRRNNAQLNIAIRGEVTTGKSTVGAKILKILIDDLIKTKHLNIPNEEAYNEYLFKQIKSDQTEYLRYTLERHENTAVLIDEFSSLGETGLNSTTEQAMYEEHSNIFAQRYVHKISCSPHKIQDGNANIILDIIGKDEEKKITQVKITYRDVITRIPLTLGIAYIDVTDIIEQPFYKRYRQKKFKRMDLLDKHGVRFKELEYSVVTLNTYEKLKLACKLKAFSEGAILSVVELVKRHYKLPYSILTLNYVVLNVKSLIDLQREVYQLKAKVEKAKSEELEKQAKESLKIFEELLKERLDEEKKKVKILEEYQNIQ